MDKNKLQNLKDSAFATKNEAEWKDVMLAIKDAVKNDNEAATALRNYCKSLLEKKKAYWEKQQAQKPKFPSKQPIFNEETQRSIQDCLGAIQAYFAAKTELLNNELRHQKNKEESDSVYECFNGNF